MYSCAFFGHRDYNYHCFEERIKDILIHFIENYDVQHFYCGARGNFDRTCTKIVYQLKKKYPFIQCIRVWAYMPNKAEEQQYFDGSVYLLDKKVPPLYAITETNKRLVDKVDFILSGVMHAWGGAWAAVERGRKQGKTVVSLIN